MYKKVRAHKNAHDVYNEKLLAEDTIHQVRAEELFRNIIHQVR
jgi:2-oxoglutarate dehydrogenase complex dehydrogenase (E1) component-like enzyme